MRCSSAAEVAMVVEGEVVAELRIASIAEES
jgi:hypothetical protein